MGEDTRGPSTLIPVDPGETSDFSCAERTAPVTAAVEVPVILTAKDISKRHMEEESRDEVAMKQTIEVLGIEELDGAVVYPKLEVLSR